MQKNELKAEKLQFFYSKFGHIKKKVYFCGQNGYSTITFKCKILDYESSQFKEGA